MVDQEQLRNILFLDIETASVTPNYTYLQDRMKALWDRKALRLDADTPSEESFVQKAGIYAEFGRVVCISCGYLKYDRGEVPTMHINSYFGPDEKSILSSFTEMLSSYNQKRKSLQLCAHNGKEFDFPFLSRRCIINRIQLPQILAVYGKKPWETPFVDTMELWKFGDNKAYTSLELLAAVLGIDSPKDDIDGSQVSEVFWREKDYGRIRKYCEKDVLTTAQVYLRMFDLPLIDEVIGSGEK